MSVASLFRNPITVKCTAKDVRFDFRSMSGPEELGRMFQYEVQLSSTAPNIDIKQILGQSLTVCLPIDLTRSRYFNGIIVRFTRAGRAGRFFLYHATVCPQLWLLTRNRDCRVFQGATVPEVVSWVLKNGNVPMSDKPVLGHHRRWEYLTQYRESDFDFISRILEQEGIYYYFKHEDGAHTLFLADSVSGHDTRPEYEAVPLYSPNWPKGSEKEDFLADWHVTYEIQTSGVSLDDYDFRLHKGAKISAETTEDPEHAHGPLVRYDYPGEYLLVEDKRDADLKATQDAGMDYAKVQLEEQRVDLERYEAFGNVRGLETGALFAVLNVPDLEGSKFLITKTHLTLSNSDSESGGGGSGADCHVSLTAINKERAFRPARTTIKPIVQGPQTARVVGDPGIGADEQIWTDEYGRIKVHFFWDRHGPSTPTTPGQGGLPGFLDHGNSCWVRVATSWAGSNWGSVHIPRIGQEVVVQFLEGDPDRPLVTGSVYNADNMPPYKLPDHKTQSGIKSRSTPKGTPSNFNEIRFEDKKGSEELHIQAEKDKSVLVKHDRSASVGANDSVSVGGDRSVTVTGNLAVTVKGAGKSPNHSSLSVTGKHNLHASDTIEVDAPTHIKLTCGGSFVLIEPGKITLQAGGKALFVLDAHVLAQSSDKSKVVLDAKVTATASAGAAVVLDANAAIDGAKVTATGKTEAVLTAAAGTVKTSAAGVDVTGPVVKING